MLEQIGIKHLKVVLGTSMGGMQTWLWGEMYPNDMDCLVAIATTPAAISGRDMVWREMVSQAIRGDPAWQNGNYPKDSPPRNWINAVVPLSAIMTGSAEQLQDQGPTPGEASSMTCNTLVRTQRTQRVSDRLEMPSIKVAIASVPVDAELVFSRAEFEAAPVN
jgi:homoserine O-acetyltransferase